MQEIRLQGFGPIGEGSLKLAPLTVLIGENGSGKSYSAMALHSHFTSSAVDRVFTSRQELKGYLDSDIIEFLEENFDQVGQMEETVIPKNIINELLESYYKSVFVKSFEERIKDTFATKLSDLITVGRNKIVVEFNTGIGRLKMGYYEGWGEFQAEKYPQVDNDVIVELVDIGSDEDNKIGVQSNEQMKFLMPYRPHGYQTNDIDYLFEGLAASLESLHFENPFDDSYYLPAPRAGFLESHDILSAGAFNTLSRAGIEPIEVPAFSGAVSSYLSEVANISKSDELTELSDLAIEFEEDVLGGKVNVEPSEDEPQPNITFSQYGREFPFHLTSTGISEVAPLTLFTKYKLNSGSSVIIEEPEAHLHPENQRKVSEYIVRLVNNGVNVIVTTHSDFFVEQLSNLVRLSGVSESRRKDSELDNLPVLKPNQISINMFYSDQGPEYTPEELEVNQIDGVPMDQFERVGDELYGQAHDIDRLLQEEYNDNE
jgi:predicted ATPase